MKNEECKKVGIAVYEISPEEGGKTVGVWLGQKVPAHQRRRIMALNLDFVPGHIGVRVNKMTGTTAVMYLGCIKSPKTAQKIAIALRRAVLEIVGAQSMLLKLPDSRSVSRALAA